MRNVYFVIIFFCVFIAFRGMSKTKVQRFAPKPVWTAEFRSNGTKTLKDWYKLTGPYETSTLYFTDSIGNLYLKNGYLHLKATSDKRDDRECSSAYVSTKGLKSFLYGKLEIRAKVPMGKGIFPAIWMLREDHPKIFPLGEIDIMEYIDCFGGKQYSITTHIVEKEPEKKEIRHKHSKRINTNMNRFHIYGLEWTPTYLRFLLDRKEVYFIDKKDAEFWPFDDPYVLIFSLGFGGWGGECGMDYSIFPREMLVDWVRYYPLLENN